MTSATWSPRRAAGGGSCLAPGTDKPGSRDDQSLPTAAALAVVGAAPWRTLPGDPSCCDPSLPPKTSCMQPAQQAATSARLAAATPRHPCTVMADLRRGDLATSAQRQRGNGERRRENTDTRPAGQDRQGKGIRSVA